MKKTFRILLAVMIISVSLLALGGCGNRAAGGYTEDREVTDDDRAIFNKAMEGMTGVQYEPEKVATQVVSGTNYRFYCKATEVIPDVTSSYVHVIIYVPLGENAVPEFVEAIPVE